MLLPATILKILSFLVFSLTAIWAGHCLLALFEFTSVIFFCESICKSIAKISLYWLLNILNLSNDWKFNSSISLYICYWLMGYWLMFYWLNNQVSRRQKINLWSIMTYSCYWLANAFALKQFFGISYQCLVTPRLSTSLSRDISTSLFKKVSTSLLARPENGPKSMCQASWDPLPLPEYLQRNRKTWFDSPVRERCSYSICCISIGRWRRRVK